jgi:hypothetical protein
MLQLLFRKHVSESVAEAQLPRPSNTVLVLHSIVE